MIAFDTNVLLRLLLWDDEEQSVKALHVFERESCILITDLVLAECLWTLRGTKYRQSKDDLISVVEKLLHNKKFRFEDNEVVSNALLSFKQTNANFTDALIVHKALKTSSDADRLKAVYTFDKAALRLPHTAEP